MSPSAKISSDSKDESTNAIDDTISSQTPSATVPIQEIANVPLQEMTVVDHYSRSNFQNVYSLFQQERLNSAIHCPNLFAIAVNSHDSNQLLDFFKYVCTPEVQVVRNEYSVARFLQKGKKLKSTHYDKEEFVKFSEKSLSMAPDSVCLLSGHRICYEDDQCSVFICMGKYVGTMMPVKPFPSKEEWKKFTSEGSFVFYRNNITGKIYRIEYYVEYAAN